MSDATVLSFGHHRTITVDGRTVEIWEPDHDRNVVRPLLLAHDGQNLFLPGRSFGGVPWGLAEALATLSEDVVLPYVIAPWNRPDFGRASDYAPQSVIERSPQVQRGLNEYFSWTDALVGGAMPQWRGDEYVAWCADRVIPSVIAECDWNVDRNQVAVMGSSMGGLASAYALACRPDVYATALCLSTHWTPGGHEGTELLVEMLPPASAGARVWFDHGTENLDATYGEFQVTADAVMRRLGYELGPQWQTRVYQGADHNEASWAQRLPEILRWWLRGDA